MRAAITRHHVAFIGIIAGLVGAFGCFRGSSLLDPSGAAGYRAPDPQVTVITLAPAAVNGAAGSHVQIAAAPVDQSGQAVSPSAVAWLSSDPSTATVSGTGMVTLVHPGKATITAIADGVTASVPADVNVPPPTSVGVTPATSLIQVGQHAQLAATAMLGSDVDSGVTVNWSSSSSGVASVSSSGLVTAVAVGTATITASVSGVTGTAKIQVTSATPVVSSVSVTPATSSVYPGKTDALSATLKDAAGDILSGITVSWATSNSSVASVSSSGVVTGNAVGSATITASAGGQNGTAAVSVTTPVVASVTVTPNTATMSPGETTQLAATARDASGSTLSVGISWTSTNASVASVSSSGLVTGNAVGSATITATSGGVNGTASVTVESGPPGGFHEPAGMSTQVNTGPISSTSVVSVFSPTTPSSAGEWSGNLAVVPGGTGLRLTYPTNLLGGYSPVRFGVGISSPGTGWYYQRMKIRFSSNWTMSGNFDVKLCEPRTQQFGNGSGATENDNIDAHGPTTSAFLFVGLQGPNGHFANLTEQPASTAADNLAGGGWHTIEVLFTPESTPGAGDGTYTGWVDGTQIAHYTGVLWLAAGNQVGWPYLMFDPTYGGGTNSPAVNMYWDFDQLYVSTK